MSLHCPQYEITPSAGSLAGRNYLSAGDDLIPSLGEQLLEVQTKQGRDGQLKYQVADVSKPLNAIGEICDAGGDEGQHVVFTKHGGFIYNLVTGVYTPFEREEGIYTMEFWVKPPTAGFQRPER